MGQIYNTDYAPINANVLKMASGIGMGDTITKIGKDLSDYGDLRQKKQYTSSVQDLLHPGLTNDLLKVDTSRLTPDAKAAIDGHLKLVRQNQADTIFNQGQADRTYKLGNRDANDAYRTNYANSGGQKDMTAYELGKGGDVSFTPELQEIVNKAYAGSKTGIDWANRDSVVNALKGSGATDTQIKGVLDTHQRLADWEAANTKLENSGHLNKTNVERVNEAIQKVVANGGTPTDKMQTALKDAQVADVKARELRSKALTSDMSTKTSALNKLLLGTAKMEVNAQGKSGYTSRYRTRRTYNPKNMTHNQWMAQIEKDVTPWVGLSNFTGVGDSHDVESLNKYLRGQGYNDRKIEYMISNLEDPGFWGNSMPSVDQAKSEMTRLGAQYDTFYNRHGYKKKVDTSKYTAEANRQVAELRDALKKDNIEMSTLGQPISATRNTYIDKLFGGSHDSKWQPPKVIHTQKGGSGGGTSDDVSKLLSTYSSRDGETTAAATNGSLNPNLLKFLKDGGTPTVAKPTVTQQSLFSGLESMLLQQTDSGNFDSRDPYANTNAVIKTIAPRNIDQYAYQAANQKAVDAAQEKANVNGFASYTDTNGVTHNVMPNGLTSSSSDLLLFTGALKGISNVAKSEFSALAKIDSAAAKEAAYIKDAPAREAFIRRTVRKLKARGKWGPKQKGPDLTGLGKYTTNQSILGLLNITK